MSVPAQIALALGAVGALLVFMTLVHRASGAMGLGPEVQRKLVHMCTGLFALTFPWLFPDRWPVYLLIGVTMIVMVILRLPAVSKGLGNTLHGVERQSYGDFLLAASVGLCFFLSRGDPLLYVLPIAVLTLADAAAALAGSAFGTRLFRVEAGHKSLEGSAVFFSVAFLVAIVCLMAFSSLPLSNVLVLALMTAAFGTLVEAQSWRGFDNLFLPLGLLVFLSVHGNSDLTELIGLALVFAATIVFFRSISRRFGVTEHAARVYVVAMFLVLAVTALQNAVLPGLVLLAHVFSGRFAPADDQYADLDVVASLALISFGWLALGNASGWNAVSFYGLTAMGLVMGLGTIAFNGRALPILGLAAALFVVRAGVVALNPPAATWAEPLTVLSIGCLSLTALVPVQKPDLFDRDRIFKLTVLALILPVGYFLAAVVIKGLADPSLGLES